MPKAKSIKCWAVLSRSKNRLDGYREHLEGTPFCPTKTMLFETRELARNYIASKYGYLKDRPDLRAEPHGWKMPKVIGVEVEIRRLG